MIKIFNKTPDIDFLGKKKIFLIFSSIFVVVSLGSFLWKGLNLGLDFKGGSVVQVLFKETLDKPALQIHLEQALNRDVTVNSLIGESDAEVLIYFSQGLNVGDAAQTIEQPLVSALESYGYPFEIRKIESIGPKIGSELKTSAWYATFISLALILIYVSFRFRLNYGIGAIVALLHDVLITMGAFSLFQVEFDLTALAGVLTLVGYSMNDTIILFDRVRENTLRLPATDINQVINSSINQTLGRTILTFTSTFIVILAMYIFGGVSIRGFSFAFLIGLVVGTYSSVFIASPFAIWTKQLN